LDLISWILIVVFIIIIILLGIKSFLLVMFYFNKMDMTGVEVEHLKIPVGDIELNANLYFPKYILDENRIPKEKIPLILFNHGWGASIDISMTSEIVVSLALGGPYAVLAYDCRGHGRSPGKHEFSEQIFNDIPKVIDFAEKIEKIDGNRLGFIGFSMGGEIALARAYPDPRIKAVIACCSPSDCRTNFARKPENFSAKWQLKLIQATGVKYHEISDEINRSISPAFILEKDRADLNNRIFLMHCKDDMTIHPREFENNRTILNLPDDQVLLCEKGGHTFLHQELLVLSNALRFYKKVLS
jgi:pimeloyl-ACP methyl ester carboxylesterase